MKDIRIAVLADIHGNFAALETVVRDIGRRGVDATVNLGDSLSGPLLPRETAQFLMAQDWVHLAGNHDRQLLTQEPSERGPSDDYAHSTLSAEEFAWLARLRPVAAFSDDLLLCHGTPASDTEYFLETVEQWCVRAATAQEVELRLGDATAGLVACGHTHVARAVRSSAGRLIVNPGSVGLPAYDDIHPVPHVIETGSPDARYAIVENRAGAWTVSLISLPYDHTSMAALAKRRHRTDWERALLSGYMT